MKPTDPREHFVWFVEKLSGGRAIVKGNKAQVECEAHEDREASVSVTYEDGTVLVKCHAGCATKDVLAARGMTMSDLFPEGEGKKVSAKRGTVKERYDYKDENGVLLRQVVRYESPKGFSRRRPDGKGGWINDNEGVRATLYKLPELQGQADVVFVEGEKDVNALRALGIAATTAGGVTSWKHEMASQIKAAGVKCLAIIPDNDKGGRQLANTVARQVAGLGVEVKIVKLPGVPEKGDVSDYLALAGNTKNTLLDLIHRAPTWDATTAPEPRHLEADADGKPTICTTDYEDMHVLFTEVFEHVVKRQGREMPEVFQLAMHLTRVRQDDEGRPILQAMAEAMTSQYLASIIRFTAMRKSGEVAIVPPPAVVSNLLARPDWDGVPYIRAVVTMPVFLADGTLITEAGYHRASRLIYDPADGVTITVPTVPTIEDVVAARDLLLDILVDFPFDCEASRAHAIAFMILPFVRELIDGPTPMHLFDGTTQGAGKGLLVECGSIIFTGAQVGMVSVPKADENELRKRITASFLGGSPYIILDNVEGELRSGALASALASRYWDDRILGLSETRRIRNQAVWAATGVNVTVHRDLARRVVVCRLEPEQEDPFTREPESFRYPRLIEHVMANRGRLASAILTLVRAWVVAGRPAVKHPSIGTFEVWADTLAGILGLAGIPGFLVSYKDTATAVDADAEVNQAFGRAWFEKYGPAWVTSKELAPLAVEAGLVKKGDDEVRATGYRLRKLAGKIMGGRKVEKGSVPSNGHDRAEWRIRPFGGGIRPGLGGDGGDGGDDFTLAGQESGGADRVVPPGGTSQSAGVMGAGSPKGITPITPSPPDPADAGEDF